VRQAEARASGSISALSRWGEVRETLAKDPRFLHNRDAGQGSCACELFDDVRVEMEQEHEVVVAKAREQLRKAAVVVTTETGVGAVAAVLTEWEEATVSLVHQSLVRGARREENRFSDLLKGYGKSREITADTTWGDPMVALLEGHSAHQAIGEPARQRLFAAFVAKLAEKKERRSHKKSKKRKKDSKRRRESRDSDDDNDSGCAAPLVIVLHRIHNPLVWGAGMMGGSGQSQRRGMGNWRKASSVDLP